MVDIIHMRSASGGAFFLYKKGAALRYAAPSCNEEFENEEEFLQVSIYAGIITWTTLILLQKY